MSVIKQEFALTSVIHTVINSNAGRSTEVLLNLKYNMHNFYLNLQAKKVVHIIHLNNFFEQLLACKQHLASVDIYFTNKDNKTNNS